MEKVDELFTTTVPFSRVGNTTTIGEGEGVVEPGDVEVGKVVRCTAVLTEDWQSQEESSEEALDETHDSELEAERQGKMLSRSSLKLKE